ncbi:MAG: hypothetical protein IH840_14735 [Candidatus Heimdallarchaeota archaeon]|nr:hypothetical protein [Candidatus Heimdallarchaeota archaeon]
MVTFSSQYLVTDYQLKPMQNEFWWQTGSRFPSWMQTPSPNVFHGIHFDLEESNSLFLSMYIQHSSQIETSPSMIMSRFTKAMTYTSSMEVILESIIVFEAVISKDDKEVGYQLRLKIAWLLAQNLEDRKLIVEWIKRLYGIRSKIVYSGGIGTKNSAKKLGGLQSAGKIAQLLLRLVILRMFTIDNNKLKFYDRSQLSADLENMLLGDPTELASGPSLL